MERKQEKQTRQMKELQAHAERLEWENNQLRAQMKKSRDLGDEELDRGQAAYPITQNKGKGPVIPTDVDTLTDDELSLGSFPPMGLSPAKNTRAKSRKRTSHRLAFSNAFSDMSRWARREASRGQYQPDRAPSDTLVLPAGLMPSMSFVHPAFGMGPTFYMLPTTLIRRPYDMLFLPLGQHIPNYEAPRRFIIPAFSMFDGSADPYDHMLRYNQAMILNASNDRLLCKVFPISLRGSALAWFHKLPHNIINSFNDLWATFVL